MAREEKLEIDGLVKESLPNSEFLVKLTGYPEGHLARTTISGKMRINNIRILPGDTVKVEVSTYDTNKGRITYRYRPYESPSIS